MHDFKEYLHLKHLFFNFITLNITAEKFPEIIYSMMFLKFMKKEPVEKVE